MKMDFTHNQIKVGALLSYATLALTNVVGILVTTFMIHMFTLLLTNALIGKFDIPPQR
jgi:hypothetical protein